MSYVHKSRSGPPRKVIRWLLAFIPLIIIGGIVYWLVFGGDKAEAPSEQSDNQKTSQNTQSDQDYTPIDLQDVVDSWANSQAADYHIEIYDAKSKTTIGSRGADKELFAASLYKIYIAYLTLVDFQTGAQNPNEILIAGQTKKECVDKMIRSSDSPCGEAMMADIGQSVLNQRVKDMGMTSTYFNGIRTSASDSSLILQHILNKRDLNEENTAFLLDAMRTQDPKFKRGLQTGAPQATWETKVGWNEDTNYHDIGIMTLPDGRKFAVAILGQGSGSSAPIADFAATIYASLTQ